MTSNPPDSVLVYVGFDRIGDGFLKLPLVRGLRAAPLFPAPGSLGWPGAKTASMPAFWPIWYTG